MSKFEYNNYFHWIWILFAIIIGIGDTGYNTLIPQIFPIIIGQYPQVFAVMRLIQAVAISCGFATFTLIHRHVRYGIVLAITIIGIAGLMVPHHIRNKLCK